jgi:cell division protein FtsB
MMSPDTIQMLAIASAVVAGIFVVQYFRYRTAVAKSQADINASAGTQIERLLSEIAALKQRVEVLEKIVTDDRSDLQARIASL